MSFMYPRTISISRQAVSTAGGLKPYSGADPVAEQVLFSGLPASIQQTSTSAKPDANLPADARSRSIWRVFMPLSAGVPAGAVLRGDIVTDDAGQRYQVWAPYVNSLGPNLLVERLEA
ncbi:Hypothetical protein bglu_1g20420 [Burkholderia glumae BGR1]|uniref:Uncharacterized protein n=2 Tax=Burkholderiaceae TaxID=119060 RepID=A0AAP9Y2C0_BURGL|nr:MULTISPECIES: hypothetical protein [Burkholderia]ACR29148.1 Hypothetical protein bglu_1g20420 [Burkholderia glumae BGR1]AJY66327.1 hypothetical protein KS03_2902 [Burkholderia glumae LMG 2196 = ATCC 33617]MBJ9663193.1 hypothetical protein [Burkholderia gladioli]PNL01304.1 hypothetical protein CEQ24_020025 [Burkholderia glumae]PRH09734.1 hypothetical protein C6V08_05625 [Burkholderia gladioli]